MSMYKLLISSALILTGFCPGMSAQNIFPWGFGTTEPQKEQKVKFTYDATFDWNFDNREFDAGKEQFTKSMTIFGARLTPSAGIRISQNKDIYHKLMIGIDVMKDFGRSPSKEIGSTEADRGLENTRLFREIIMYYGIYANLNDWKLRGYAGVFPRSFSEGPYSRAFFSDSLKFYDNNLEGLLFKAARPGTYMELAFDWNGKYGDGRREQFNIFGYGHYEFTDFLMGGLAFKYHHYANTETYGSVVDDALVQPFIRFEFGKFTGLQGLYSEFSMYQALQQDRRDKDNGKSYPYGAEMTLGIRNWNVGIENRLYYGKDLMPFYNYTDDGGYKYGNNLYSGSPFYRILPEHNDHSRAYDRFEVFYEPHIASFVNLRLSIAAYFPDNFKYAGLQQMMTLVFNLDKLLNPSPDSKKHYNRRRDRTRTGETIIFGL